VLASAKQRSMRTCLVVDDGERGRDKGEESGDLHDGYGDCICRFVIW
jgi:hypothetical protein